MKNDIDDDQAFINSTIREHLDLGENKSVSYLPISTIKNILGLRIAQLTKMATDLGLEYELTRRSEACIKSGSLRFYNDKYLNNIIKNCENKDVISRFENPRQFIKDISRKWYNEDDPMMLVIKRAFGDTQ